jgi:hypothetical protein
MDSENAVRLTTVSSEVEAEMFCGLLRAGGIECGHRVTDANDSVLDGFLSDGPREIFVHERDLSAARALLPDAAG